MGQASDLSAGRDGGPDLSLRLAGAEVELWLARPGPEPEARSLAARELLAARLDVETRALRIVHDERGAPRLALEGIAAAAGGAPAAPRDSSISISHTGPWLAVALAHEVSVGVDIEPRARRVRPGAIERVLGEEELRRVRSLPEEERPQALLRCWTVREACGKALGTGLAGSDEYASSRFDVRAWDPVAELIGAVAALPRR